MERLFDRPVSELIGRSDADLFGEEAATHIQERDAQVLAGEILEEEHTKPVLGEPHTFHVIKVPMRGADGAIQGICGIARDITEIRRLHDLSERAQRLEAAGKIAGQVAHDFSNLLGPLLAYPDLVREAIPPGRALSPQPCLPGGLPPPTPLHHSLWQKVVFNCLVQIIALKPNSDKYPPAAGIKGLQEFPPGGSTFSRTPLLWR